MDIHIPTEPPINMRQPSQEKFKYVEIFEIPLDFFNCIPGKITHTKKIFHGIVYGRAMQKYKMRYQKQ